MITLLIVGGVTGVVLLVYVVVEMRRDTREQPPVSAKWLDENVYRKEGGDR